MAFGSVACFSRDAFELPKHQVQHAVLETVANVESNGDVLRIDIYRPEQNSRYPTVLLLHGSGGIHELGPQQTGRYARTLAAMGFAALVVHYFDGTGNFIASDADEREHYWRWVSDVRSVITWADSLPFVNRGRVSILGISLGGFVGVGVGATDHRVWKIALVGGGLEPFLGDSLHRAPPLLLLHGEADTEVAPEESQKLFDAMINAGRHVERVLYPGQGHTLDDSASTDALIRAAHFFRRWR